MAVFLLALFGAVQAAHLGEAVGENPIRRIVNLLQQMQTEITTEGERDKDLTEKFVCYCKTNDGDLSSTTAEARAKIPEIESDISEAVALKARLDQELTEHKADRVAAKEAIGSATKQREKEAEEFAASSGELKGNINSCNSAVDALTKGLQGSFLQSSAANTLRNLVVNTNTLDRYGRETLTDFLSLSTNAHYTPVSNEVIGILKTMQEGMEKDLAEITAVEDTALTTFEGLVSAKEKEIAAATAAIETKTGRAGETAVQIVSLKNDLEDTKESLGADERFLLELKKDCSTKADEFDARNQIRGEELVAISETIKVLNDDDALDLFKKTLATPSLLQTVLRERDVRLQAAKALQKAKKGNAMVNYILLALNGKKQGFEKVLKMIDNLVTKLGEEQKDDDAQREWCNKEFDSAEDTAKDSKRRIESFETRIAENEESIAKLVDEVTALQAGIKALDRAVEDASDTRRDEHKEYVQTAAENSAALQLLEVAKNRLNKFYNPKLYKAAPKRELTEDEQIYVNSGGADPRVAEAAAVAGQGIAGTGIESPLSFVQVTMRDAPPPPPETVDAYTKRDSSGPVALIDRLKNDLSKDVQENKHDEEESQKDYEAFMSDSVAKRTADSKAVTEKEAQKAELEGDLMAAKDQRKTKVAELMATQEYIAQLHGSCDFLVANFDLRKDARANEVEALKNAKAVLSGADFSFAQARSKHFLMARPGR